MKYATVKLTSLLLGLSGIICNGGDHHHHHHHGGGVPPTEELTDLIQNFGLAVLGKDQESADDVQPTEDHSHINIKALINELFHPSTTSTTTTPSPVTTSTQRLPIKSHDFGWELSPIDLVMSNSILEPVFSQEQQERHSRRSRPVYLTETPYLRSHDRKFNEPGLRSGKSLDLDSINLDPDQLIDKPTLPVLDTRRANFLLVNGGKRSKTGRRKKISRTRPNVKKSHSHGHDGEDDVLWRETVWSLKFRQTTAHPNLLDEATTQTPLSDLSPFLHQLEESSARQESHQTAKKSHDSEETAGLRDGSRGSQEKSLTGRRQNRKGSARPAGKSSRRNCKDHERNSDPLHTRHLENADNILREEGAIPASFQSFRRRGKKSDDMRESNHHDHEDIADDEVEDIILRDDKLHFALTGDVNHKAKTSQVKSGPNKKNAVRRGKKLESQQRTSKQNLVDNKRQGHTDSRHQMRTSFTRNSFSITRNSITRSTFECQDRSEGLHPDLSSGCQVFYMCHENGRSGRFTCPEGTLFSRHLGVCDWAKNVQCNPPLP